MGTRGLTAVVIDGKYRIAQYGQWDHYLDGQGADILEFLRGADLGRFREQVGKTYFLNDKQLKAAYKPYSTNGSMTMAQAERFKASPWGHLSRDTGGKILAAVMGNTAETIGLVDESEFAKDGLFCEFVYVIDLDRGTFEIYDGFHKERPAFDQRFCGTDSIPTEGEYYPVQLLMQFSLDALPEEFPTYRDEEGERLAGWDPLTASVRDPVAA